MSRIPFVLGIVLGSTLLGGAVSAQTFTAYDLTSPAVGNEQYGATLGLAFTVNAPIMVTSLGAFDSINAATGGPHTLNGTVVTTIYNSLTQAPVAGLTATFSAANPGTLSGGYLYQTVGGLSGVTLAPGNYVVAWTSLSNNDPDGNSNFANFTAATPNTGGNLITLNTTTYQYSQQSDPSLFGKNSYPTQTFTGKLDAGTFKFSAVTPEPGTVSLFGSLFVAGGSALLRRRRKKTA